MILACGLIWGSQYAVNALILQELDAMWIATFRAGIGALCLYIACRYLKLRSNNKDWPMIFIIAMLEASIPFLLVAWGQQHTASSVAAVITGTNPILTLLLAPIILKGTRITCKSLICAGIGFMGILYLFWPQLQQPELNQISGALAIFVATCSFALSLLLVKKLKHIHPIVLARDVILLSTLQLLPIASMTSGLPTSPLSLESTAAIIYLGVFCGGIVYILFMTLILEKGPDFASFSNYLVPSIGVLIAFFIEGSSIDNRIFLSLSMIIASIFIYQYSDKIINKLMKHKPVLTN